jgi:hypothetical protein
MGVILHALKTADFSFAARQIYVNNRRMTIAMNHRTGVAARGWRIQMANARPFTH